MKHMTCLFSGKTVISKERAFQKQREDPEKPVYFISLLGSTDEGKPEKTRYIFDVLTKWFEFDGQRTKVQAVDVQDLQSAYDNFKQIFEAVGKAMGNTSSCPILKPYEEPLDTYDLAKFFIRLSIQRYPDSSFVFDEVPFKKEGREHRFYKRTKK